MNLTDSVTTLIASLSSIYLFPLPPIFFVCCFLHDFMTIFHDIAGCKTEELKDTNLSWEVDVDKSRQGNNPGDHGQSVCA